jgi:hypothetical protein
MRLHGARTGVEHIVKRDVLADEAEARRSSPKTSSTSSHWRALDLSSWSASVTSELSAERTCASFASAGVGGDDSYVRDVVLLHE